MLYTKTNCFYTSAMNNPKMKFKKQLYLCLDIQNKIPMNKLNHGCPRRWQQEAVELAATVEHTEIRTSREQLLLWDNWGTNERLLDNREKITEKAGKRAFSVSCGNSPDWGCQWTPLFTSRSTSTGRREALWGCSADLQGHRSAIPATASKRSKKKQQGVTTPRPPCPQALQPSKPVPQGHTPLPSFTQPVRTTQHIQHNPHRSLLHKIALYKTNKRDGTKAAGRGARELSENSRDCRAYRCQWEPWPTPPPHPHRAGGNFTQVLWPTCKGPAEQSWRHHPASYGPKQREQQDEQSLIHAPGVLPGPLQPQAAEAPSAPTPCQMHPAHTAHTKATSTQGHCFQDGERAILSNSYK